MSFSVKILDFLLVCVLEMVTLEQRRIEILYSSLRVKKTKKQSKSKNKNKNKKELFKWIVSDQKRKSGFCAVSVLNIFKEAIYEDPHLALSNWNALDADPCDWNGISCSGARDHVIKM